MRLKTIRNIFAKEILDTLRDRRTLLFMIVIPVLLYPAIMIFLNELATSQQAKMEQRVVKIALIHVAEDSTLRKMIMLEPKIQIVAPARPIEAVRNGEVDYALELPPNAEEILKANGTATAQLHYDRSNDNATVNLDRVTKLVEQYGDSILKNRLKARSLSEEYFEPVKLQEVNEASKQKMGGFVIGRFLPMLMVIMVLAGSLYPAIDMTAGEKERGTLETILTSPATRTEIVIGKFLTVMLIALLTGLLNMGSMIGTFAFGIFKEASATLQINIPLRYVLIMIACLVPLAVFFAGTMMTLASFARSFKEAQNLLTPIYLLGTMPAMVSTIPGIELEGFWLTLPVANITLLFKELMLGTLDSGHIFVVFFSVSFLACIALFLAIKLFGREEVLFGEVASFGLAFKRVNITAKPLPSAPESLFFAMLALALLLYAGVPMQMKDVTSGVILTELLIFLLLPVGYAAYLKLDLPKTFRLNTPSPTHLLCATLFFAGIQCIAPTLVHWQSQVFPTPKDLMDNVEKLESLLSGQSFAQTFLFLALIPAICEETSFRGLIFAGLLVDSKPWRAILITSFFFGIFHLSLHRFLPVFLIGVCATYLVWKSGSIFTGMMLHMLVNGWAAFLIHFPEKDFTGMLTAKSSFLLVILGIVFCASGFLIAAKKEISAEKG